MVINLTKSFCTSNFEKVFNEKFKGFYAHILIYIYLVLLSKEETKDLEEKLKLQQQESARRENVLVMRLTAKEQEMQDLLVCI